MPLKIKKIWNTSVSSVSSVSSDTKDKIPH